MPNTNNQQPPISNNFLVDLAAMKAHCVEMMFFPSAWGSANNTNRAWLEEIFPPVDRQVIPKAPGVYVFVVEPGLFGFEKASGLFYVGKATSLFDRIKAYIDELSKTLITTARPLVWRMINQWNGHLKYYYTITDSVTEAEILENEMINAFRPYFNTQYDAEVSPFMRAF
ncbi:nucleotide excision repair endonuclease [Methylobacillus gramineus]|uniref:nucleotide excision repair endonuclease n=1 Tax=Methylobacillus gramineus TaxID=755169 RepID=UPI001CFFA937|nr:nucleotide excision repair endonuclease [Methylobacillus gramineus]MCB5186141.1 nucleotide excision repair endonuclease [Methylobacillus gramineus]